MYRTEMIGPHHVC